MSPLASGGRDRYSFELALDRYVCYPMESVELTVRVRLENPMRTILCLHLPQKTEIETVHMDDVDDNYLTVYTHDFDGRLLAVQLSNYMEPGQTSDLHLTIRLNSIRLNNYLNFCAWMAADVPNVEGDFFVSSPCGTRDTSDDIDSIVFLIVTCDTDMIVLFQFIRTWVGIIFDSPVTLSKTYRDSSRLRGKKYHFRGGEYPVSVSIFF